MLSVSLNNTEIVYNEYEYNVGFESRRRVQYMVGSKTDARGGEQALQLLTQYGVQTTIEARKAGLYTPYVVWHESIKIRMDNHWRIILYLARLGDMIHKNTPVSHFKLWVVMLKGIPSYGKIERVVKAPNAHIIIGVLDNVSELDFCFRIDLVDWNTGISVDPKHPLIETSIRKHFEKHFIILSYRIIGND